MRILIMLALLTGCAAQQQRELNNAYASGQQAKQLALAACADSTDVTGCMLGVAAVFGGNGSNGPPVVQSDLSVILNSSVIGAGIGAIRDVRVASSQERTQIASINANAATQQAQTAAFAAVATGGFQAIGNTASNGFGAIRDTSATAFGALSDVAQSGFTFGIAAIDAQAQATGAWAATIAGMPPTYQLGDGSMIIAGDDNTSQTGGGTIDQSAVGRDRDVTRNCTATSTATASGTSTGTSSGTTGPNGMGGALGFYPQAPSNNDCGG